MLNCTLLSNRVPNLVSLKYHSKFLKKSRNNAWFSDKFYYAKEWDDHKKVILKKGWKKN